MLTRSLALLGRGCNKILAAVGVRSKTTVMTSAKLVWVDMEMTGLDANTDHIMEIACVITDGHLNTIDELADIIIHQPDHVLDGMDQWCTKHHGDSGLTAACKASQLSLKDAEQTLLKFLQQHTSEKQCPLAGNSVHADKRFIDRHMPLVSNHLHYRIVDVSTIKELCSRWYPDDYSKAPVKQRRHRAVDDIHESIQELKYYQRTIFKHTS